MNVKYQKASLTVEAALILPVFLYFIMSFLYYIQIFTTQEHIQASITEMGLNLSKSAYILKDFPSSEEALSFDFSIFGENFELPLEDMVNGAASSGVLRLYAKRYLDTDLINQSCIKGGFDGISFTGSSLIGGDGYIDIIASYQVEIPVKIFSLPDMQMIQRVRLRCWTGYEVAAVYEVDEESDQEEATVFITETGSVYHKTDACSHIKLSVTSVQGIPTGLRNDNGSKYYPCESCCNGKEDKFGTYYITAEGTRYHTRRDCSRIKRSVKEVPISEVDDKTPCKRCYK